MAQVMVRTGAWLSLRAAGRGCQCAIVSSGVIRAMVIQLLDAPVSAFQRIDILPLSMTVLRSLTGLCFKDYVHHWRNVSVIIFIDHKGTITLNLDFDRRRFCTADTVIHTGCGFVYWYTINE